MLVVKQKYTFRYGQPLLVDRKLPFKNLDKIPFKIFVKGSILKGTITPIGEILSGGIPWAFQVRIPGKRLSTITYENDLWAMAADEDLVFELGVWIELYYQ